MLINAFIHLDLQNWLFALASEKRQKIYNVNLVLKSLESINFGSVIIENMQKLNSSRNVNINQ